MASSRPVEDIQFDAVFVILKLLCVEKRRTARTYYPIVQPDLPFIDQSRYASYATTADVLGREESLVPYFRDIQRLCDEYPGHINRSVYFRTETVLFAHGQVIARPWIDLLATDPKPSPHRLYSQDDGQLLFEPDQAETLEIEGLDDEIFYHFYQTDPYRSLVNIRFPRKRFQSQLSDAEERLVTIVATICRQMGVTSWHALLEPELTQ